MLTATYFHNAAQEPSKPASRTHEGPRRQGETHARPSPRRKVARFASEADLDAYLENVAALSIHGLRDLWRKERGGDPPRALTKDLMARALSYWAQEEVFGGLTREEEKRLAAIAKGLSDPVRRLKAGSIVVREHGGEMHEVMVALDGYVWRGRTFASLSAIALEITGTSWNGFRFFGLQARKERANAKSGAAKTKSDDGAGEARKRTPVPSFDRQPSSVADGASSQIEVRAADAFAPSDLQGSTQARALNAMEILQRAGTSELEATPRARRAIDVEAIPQAAQTLDVVPSAAQEPNPTTSSRSAFERQALGLSTRTSQNGERP